MIAPSLADILDLQNYHLSWWSLPPLLASLYFIAICGLIFAKTSLTGSTLAFAIYSMSASIWLSSYSICFSTIDPTVALFWSRTAYLGIPFIAVAMWHFGVEFTQRTSQRKWVWLSYLAVILFLPFTRRDSFLGGVRLYFWGFYPYRTSFRYEILLLSFLIFWAAGLCNLYDMLRRETSPLRRKQLKVLCAAFLIGTTAFADFAGKYLIPIYPFGYLPVAIFLTMIFYAITRYQLLGIETVVHRTVLWALCSLLLMVPVYVLWDFLVRSNHARSALELTAISFGLFVLFKLHSKHLQPRIDHLLRRRKYDYFSVFGKLLHEIGGELDIHRILERLLTTFSDTLYVRNAVVMVIVENENEPRRLYEVADIGYEETCFRSGLAELEEDSPLFEKLESEQAVVELAHLELERRSDQTQQGLRSFFHNHHLELLIPLIASGGKLVGAIGLGRRQNLRKYGRTDILLLGNIGKLLSNVIDNAIRHRDIVEKERLDQELRLGRRIQNSLMPTSVPTTCGLSLVGVTIPAMEIGGDYFDFIPHPENDELSIAIGDVSGKGVGAGLLMAVAKTAVTICSEEEDDPRMVLQRTNKILFQHMLGQNFMSLLYMRWNRTKHAFRYGSAGHEHIIVIRKDPPPNTPVVQAIRSGGFVLGVSPDVASMLNSSELLLRPGDKVVLYTDGVTEALDPQGNEFTLEKLVSVIEGMSDLGGEALLDEIKRVLADFMRDEPQHDDITLVIMEAI